MSKRQEREREREEAIARARRKQMIAAIIIGAAIGGLLWWLTTFWMWLPAGVSVGLATGAIMKPPVPPAR